MIRVAIVDRHPTVRAGLDAILAAQPDLVAVGDAADARELWPLLHRARPDVVVLDASPAPDALALCLQITSRVLGPRVVLFATDVSSAAIVPATLAGADALSTRPATCASCCTPSAPSRAASTRCRGSPRGCRRRRPPASRSAIGRSSPCAWPGPRSARSPRPSG